MKKKFHPKKQTEELKKAEFEFLIRNKEKFEKIISDPAWQSFSRRCRELKIDQEELDDILRDTLVREAVYVDYEYWAHAENNANKRAKLSPETSYNDLYVEEMAKDAEKLVRRLIDGKPNDIMIAAIDLTRPGDVILAEIRGILEDAYRERKRTRSKWLTNAHELLEVWDLWALAGQKPWQRSMTAISRKVGRPVSTVKTQWRMAYEKIHGKPYDPQTKYVNEEKRANADTLCANCPHGAKCYTRGDWYPCADYRKLTGKERSIKTVEYTDGIKND